MKKLIIGLMIGLFAALSLPVVGQVSQVVACAVATSSVLGCVKPDGTTITNTAGAISTTYGTTASTATQGNDIRLGAGVVTGAVKSNGSNTFSQAACADLSNGTTNCSAVVGQIPGTTINDNASAGKVGEFLSTTLAGGSAISLSASVAATIVSHAFTAGDWDITCDLYSYPAASTVISSWYGSISTSTNTLDFTPGALQTSLVGFTATPAGGYLTLHIGPIRASLNGTTTYYCVTQQNTIEVSTSSAYGIIRGRRVR